MNYFEIAILNSPLSEFTYEFNEDIDIGRKVKINLRNREVFGIIIKKVEEPDFKCLPILEITNYFISLEYLDIAKFISTYYFSSLGEALGLFIFFKDNQKFVNKEIDIKVELSNLQNQAFNFCKNNKKALIFGDTGCGKTEIYMKYFEKVVNNNQSAIFLLPEISLTPQMEQRLKDKFGDLVVIWHSKIGKKKKDNILNDIYNGKVKIVAGARSSLFLPLQNLGLIVVDEEHDDSYKANKRPRYNTRDLAIYFAHKLNINVILGTATPSLTSFNKFKSFRLKGNFFNTKKEFIFENSSTRLTPLIINEIKNTLDKKEQIIVFIPTRGNFKYLICDNCGASLKCPYCDVTMTLHRNDKKIMCHYCHYVERIPSQCPSCVNGILLNKRVGTAEILEQLQEVLPNNVISKFDRDEVTTDAKLRKILTEFNNKKIDILVGTQMLSKGHNYHNVNLAIILGIDNILNIPDFKSRERTFSLLFQIAGRSGRKTDGKVLIQTLNGDFFQSYLDDYQDFLDDELEYREELYPPFKKLARIVIAHKNIDIAKNQLDEVVKKLEQFENIEIVGYGEAPIQRIANKFRFNILLRSDKSVNLIKSINTINSNLTEIDIDPISFI